MKQPVQPGDAQVFFDSGCGRCELADTPACKVHAWTAELAALRSICLASGLEETRKWGAPCYTRKGKNIVLIGALKACSVLSFPKGELLRDEAGLLEAPGPHTRLGRVYRVRSLEDIRGREDLLLQYIREAIALEDSAVKPTGPSAPEMVWPDELVGLFREDPAFQKAFAALTPGRQRGYLLFFAQAKQSATRLSRILKQRDAILAGRGMHDR